MKTEAMVEMLNGAFPEALQGVATPYGDLVVTVVPAHLVALIKFLRDEEALHFDQLLDIATVDNLKRPAPGAGPDSDQGGYEADERFEVIYILNSTRHNHRVRVKVILPEEGPVVPSLCALYGSANWGEREAWDMMGIRFEGHPNLKRILTHYKFVGHALRKDYPVNREQWLDTTEPMLDEVLKRLEERGIPVRLEDR